MINEAQLEEFIKTFNKEPGEFSVEEQIRIGVEFKKLPVKKRNWDTLISRLGSKLTKEALRKKVARFLKNNPDLVSDEDQGEIYVNDYIEQQKVRDWYNAYRRDIREEARIQNLKEEIARAAEKFKDLPSFKYEDSSLDFLDGEAILLLSDMHIGVDCSNYYNKYNKDIAKTRLEKLLKKVISYCQLNNVKELHVLNLGDMIQGLIHTNARIEAQMDVSEQIILAGELLSSFLNGLQKAAPIITYRSVFDNHSRAVADKNEHIEKEQFSRIIDWFIKERLRNTDICFVDNKIDGGIGELYLNDKRHIMFAHGHQDGRNNSVQNFIGLTREWVDYICLAHYHNPASKDYQGCKVFINGSIVGTESYAFGRRLFTKPSQKLLIFRKHDEDIQDIDIGLD